MIRAFPGQSGTGKSTLTSNLLDRMAKGRKVLILNNRHSSAEKVNKSWKPVSWADVPKAKKVALVIEDLISIDKKKKDVLLNLLSWSNHHARVSPIVAIGHQVSPTIKSPRSGTTMTPCNPRYTGTSCTGS